ncbi:MAG: hypothetical protein MJZ09_05720 [Bacteroidales bacterium]|nr:hypothetical protein [Bacteroidales bacterium]
MHLRARIWIRIAMVATAIIAGASRLGAQEMHDVLKESRISAKGARRSMPRFGIPLVKEEKPATNILCTHLIEENIVSKKRVWSATETATGMPAWVSWDLVPADSTEALAHFTERLGPNATATETWQKVAGICREWASEKPSVATTVVCGPMVMKGSSTPYAYFVAICRRTKSRIGFKSIGFLIENSPAVPSSAYNISCSVNFLEYLSGYDLFPLLPKNIQEMVEDMTTYELFSRYQENGDYLDMYEGIDPEDFRNELFEDMRYGHD